MGDKTFTAKIEITPDDDRHCGECFYVDSEHVCCNAFDAPNLEGEQVDKDRWGDLLRCAPCIAAEKKWRKKNP